MYNRNQIGTALGLVIIILAAAVSTLSSKTWTEAELTALTDHAWIWSDPKYTYAPDTIQGGEIKPPKRLLKKNPEFPKEASAALGEGTVKLKVLIDEKGKVRKVMVFEDSDTRLGFEESAIAAACKTSWAPATRDGKRIPAWVVYDVNFYRERTENDVQLRPLGKWHWARVEDKYTMVPAQQADSLSAATEGEEESSIDPFAFVAVSTPPVKIKDVLPRYPEDARKAGQQGTVWIKILVDQSGVVREAFVLAESGCNCGFEEAALRSALSGRWKPAVANGTPVMGWVSYPVNFRLQ
ncbi:MAG: TonB family protein [candidate division Zixibacteria bacterium]|nr:TonB family protein [candidate division Zixibacteria bacterium]